MIEPLRRIGPAHEIGYALNGVRLAQVAVANRARAKTDMRGFGWLFPVGTVIWWAVLLLANWLLPGSYAALGALTIRCAIWLSVFSAGLLTVGILLPSAFGDAPAVPKRRFLPDKGTSFSDVLLMLATLALFPVVAAFGIANLLATMRHDPVVKVTGYEFDERVTANMVLADDRTKKLYGDLVGQIDDWNEAINPVNRLIHLANAEEEDLAGEEATLVADYHAQQADLDRLVALATALLSEGQLGTRPSTDGGNAEDPLLRLHDRVPRIREHTRSLAEDSKRLVAAREVHAATNRT